MAESLGIETTRSQFIRQSFICKPQEQKPNQKSLQSRTTNLVEPIPEASLSKEWRTKGSALFRENHATKPHIV